MKKSTLITLLLFLCLRGVGQQVIEMNADKVTQFIFPSAIASLKGGYLPSQILEEINENVLYMQPIGSFAETNLNVITSNGQYFHFILRYVQNTQKFSHIIKESDAFYSKENSTIDKSASKPLKNTFERQLKKTEVPSASIVKAILSESGYLACRNSVRYKKMYLTVRGIYVSNDKLYFRIMVENKSNISYDVDMISFLVKAQEKSRNATQESTQLFWTSVSGNDKSVPANGHQELVFEFDKFTIGSEKILNVEMVERSGERNLVLSIDNDWVINAREIRL